MIFQKSQLSLNPLLHMLHYRSYPASHTLPLLSTTSSLPPNTHCTSSIPQRNPHSTTMKRTLSGQIKPPSTSSKTMSPPISSTTQAPNAFKYVPTATSHNRHYPLTPHHRDKLTTVVTVTTRGAPHKEAKQVTLHKGMLPAKSPFLARACRDRDEVKLLDVDSEAFGVFAVSRLVSGVFAERCAGSRD